MDKTKTEMETELYNGLLKQLRCDLVEMTQKLFSLPLTIPQVAEILGCSCNSLYKKMQKGNDRKFFKIYKPQSKDKAYRFSYYPEGERPKEYINGYDELKKQDRCL